MMRPYLLDRTETCFLLLTFAAIGFMVATAL